MEPENFEGLFLLIEKYKEMDDTGRELYRDLKEFAYKYANMRYKFSDMDRQEKIANDSYRTSLHNRFMDCVRIYLRYLQKAGVETPDIKALEDDRKIFGNFACYFIFRVECGEA